MDFSYILWKEDIYDNRHFTEQLLTEDIRILL